MPGVGNPNRTATPVIDCHAHLLAADLTTQPGTESTGLGRILARCDGQGVVGVVFSLYVEARDDDDDDDDDSDVTLDCGDASPLAAIDEISAHYDIAVGVSAGICPPLERLDATMESWLESAEQFVRDLARDGRIVAIGECGLDYYWPLVNLLESAGAARAAVNAALEGRREELLETSAVRDVMSAQQAVFRECVRWANELELPLVVHGRDAYEDIFRIVAEGGPKPEQVMLHCFAGTKDEAEFAAQRGYRISIPSSAGHREKFRSVVEVVGLESLVVETDSPCHSPFHGQWKASGRAVRELAVPAGLVKAARKSWRSEQRRRLFAHDVESRYPGLEFHDPVTSVPVSVGDWMRSSGNRATNEPTFVRSAATAIAEVKGVDPMQVCEETTRNARRLFGSRLTAGGWWAESGPRRPDLTGGEHGY